MNKFSIIISLLPVCFFMYPMVTNNLALLEFENKFKKLEHPKNSQRIFINGAVTLRGNGDHCDLYVIEFRSYEDRNNYVVVSNFYKNMKITTNTKNDGEIQTRLSVYSEERFKDFSWDKDSQLLLKKARKFTGKPIYIITSTVVYSDVSLFYLDHRCI